MQRPHRGKVSDTSSAPEPKAHLEIQDSFPGVWEGEKGGEAAPKLTERDTADNGVWWWHLILAISENKTFNQQFLYNG